MPSNKTRKGLSEFDFGEIIHLLKSHLLTTEQNDDILEICDLNFPLASIEDESKYDHLVMVFKKYSLEEIEKALPI